MGMVNFVGGAMIGWVRATWPLAILSVSPRRMTLKVLIIGRYEFNPEQVISIEKVTKGWLRGCIAIRHAISKYPLRILFATFGSNSRTLSRIEEAGFLPSAKEEDKPKRQGIAMRWQTIAISVILWNILLGIDWFYYKSNFFSSYSIIAISLFFIVSVFIRWSPALQRIILKPGRSFEEAKHWFNLIACIMGFFLVFTFNFGHLFY